MCRLEFQAYCHSQLATLSNSADCLKTASKQEICQWVVKAQNYLSEMITKSFKVTGISLALNGSEDRLFRNKDMLQPADQPEDEEQGDEEEEDPVSSDSDSEGNSEDEKLD